MEKAKEVLTNVLYASFEVNETNLQKVERFTKIIIASEFDRLQK